MKISLKEFLIENKVVFTGAIGALAIALQQFLGKPEVDPKALGIAAGVAILSYFANQWKGKGFTIGGIISTVAGAIVVPLQGGEISWVQIVLSVIISLGFAVSPNPELKSDKSTEK